MDQDSHEGQIRRMEQALEQARDAAPGTPVAHLRERLEHQLAAIRAAWARQHLAAAEAVELTRQRNEMIDQGRELAIRLRHLIRAKLGPRDVRLKAFGIAPLGRPRQR